MKKNNEKKIFYYLFCMNNILALFAVYDMSETNMEIIFSIFTLSSFGLFLGVYLERNGVIRALGNLSDTIFVLYFFRDIDTFWRTVDCNF